MADKNLFSGRALYFTDTPATRGVAEAVGKRFNFRLRPVALENARKTLPSVPERAALLWGDGFEHHLSHFFEVKGGKGLKSGIDAHLDMGGSPQVSCDSHFRHSSEGNHHVSIFLPYWRGGFQVAESIGISGPYTHTHISIDMDAIDCFPCSGQFSSGSAKIDALVRLLDSLVDERLMRFDIGGMKRNPTQAEFDTALGMYMRVFEAIASGRVDAPEIRMGPAGI